MQVEVFDHVAGAREARGIAVVIDVFRAFSVAAYAFDAGAARVLPVAAIEDAKALGRRFPGAVLAGERHARRLPGFDIGNSPTEVRARSWCTRPTPARRDW
jgi:2-phosphosulfolactate phosphatase